MLLIHSLQLHGYSKITKEDIGNYFLLWKLSDDYDTESETTIELCIAKNNYLQIRESCEQIIQNKPQYIIVLQDSKNLFYIKESQFLSHDELIIIEDYKRNRTIFSKIMACLLALAIYIIYLKI